MFPQPAPPFFAPQLITSDGDAAIEFYKQAFGAVLQGRWDNPDGTVHVAELNLQGAVFHLREASAEKRHLSPLTAGGNTVIVGIFVNDVDVLMASALAAGAELMSPAQDYDYHYRQGAVRDPFGHHWLIEKKI